MIEHASLLATVIPGIAGIVFYAFSRHIRRDVGVDNNKEKLRDNESGACAMEGAFHALCIREGKRVI